MSDSFNLEIVNPEKLFLSLDNVSEVVVPAFEGDMGILKDHISIISFLKPGIVKVFTGNEVKELYVEDGIIEFSENSLSILTSRIIDIKEIKKDDLSSMIIIIELKSSFFISFMSIILLVRIDKEFSLNSIIPSSTYNSFTSLPVKTLTIPGFKNEIIDM